MDEVPGADGDAGEARQQDGGPAATAMATEITQKTAASRRAGLLGRSRPVAPRGTGRWQASWQQP